MNTVLCVGEALISLTPPTGATLATAPELVVSAGGAEVNVAVHLARIGVPTRFAGRVGADPFGARLLRTLQREGVDVEHVDEDPQRPTGLYLKDADASGTIMRYYRSDSAATRYRRVPPRALDGVRSVHTSGITPALSPDCRALVEDLVAAPHLRTSFDVNFRPALWDPAAAAEVLLGLARRADVVFVGLDEAGAVWGCRTPADVRELLPEPSELVVKDGPRPATAFADRSCWAVPAPEVEVVEPVGAGDAFAAGYLAARYFGHAPERALRWGHVLAGTVMQVLGDQGPDGGATRRAMLVALRRDGGLDDVVA